MIDRLAELTIKILGVYLVIVFLFIISIIVFDISSPYLGGVYKILTIVYLVVTYYRGIKKIIRGDKNGKDI